MKKILFSLIFILLIGSFAFAEGETEEISKTDNDTAPKIESDEKNAITLVNLYAFNEGITLSSFPVFDGETLMLPMKEFLSYLGANDFSVDAENQVTITYGEKIVALFLDSKSAVFNHEAVLLASAPFLLGDIVYAPAEEVCRALGFTFKTDYDLNMMSVYADIPENELYSEKFVNNLDLPSETQYLIWVNKGKYTVYVFLGKNGAWREIYSCKCSIGAPASPTITGVFKYISLEKRWTYDDFYVGPIMRFYGSYAIHSTLLKFDGTDYNNAVGVKNSHGCVRVRPDNLNWLVSYVPIKTTVFVSDN